MMENRWMIVTEWDESQGADKHFFTFIHGERCWKPCSTKVHFDVSFNPRSDRTVKNSALIISCF